MILNSNSIIRFLPQEMDKRTLLIFDSLRFTIDMIDRSWNQLNSLLEILSNGKSEKDLPAIFINAWSIIDNMQRFINLYELLPVEFEIKGIDSLKEVKSCRNTFAHLDERIDTPLLKTNSPFYGALIWEYKNMKDEKIDVYIAISGLQYGTSHRFDITEFNKVEKQISNIKLETVDRSDKVEINIEKLIISLLQIVQKLEKNLDFIFNEKEYKRDDWKHKRDILLIMKNED